MAESSRRSSRQALTSFGSRWRFGRCGRKGIPFFARHSGDRASDGSETPVGQLQTVCRKAAVSCHCPLSRHSRAGWRRGCLAAIRGRSDKDCGSSRSDENLGSGLRLGVIDSSHRHAPRHRRRLCADFRKFKPGSNAGCLGLANRPGCSAHVRILAGGASCARAGPGRARNFVRTATEV
jgi:hypothetical protein